MSEQEQSDARKDRCRGLKRPKHKIPKTKAREEDDDEQEVDDKQGKGGRSTHPLTDSSWCREVASSLPASEGVSSTTSATSTALERVSSTTSATSTALEGVSSTTSATSIDIDESRHREDAESELNLRREAAPITKESSFEAKRRAFKTKHAYCIGEEIMKDDDFDDDDDDDDDDNQGETSDFRTDLSYIDRYRVLR